MATFMERGAALRQEAQAMVVEYLRLNGGKAGELGLQQKQVFDCCGLSWGDHENASAKQQVFWMAGLLRDLEAQGVVERDPESKRWRLK